MSDGADVRSLVPNDPRIRHIHIEGTANIGEKRNFACERARGEIIAHWDDDDSSAPGRVADQVERLRSAAKAVTGYGSMRFHQHYRGGPEIWWMFEFKKPDRCALGTSLCYRRDWWQGHKFLAKQIAEDASFVETAYKFGELVTAPANDLMYATIHDGNTSPRLLDDERWKRL